MTDTEIIYVDKLTFLPKNPKECLEYIKECRKPEIDKVIEKMESSTFYSLFIDKFELVN